MFDLTRVVYDKQNRVAFFNLELVGCKPHVVAHFNFYSAVDLVWLSYLAKVVVVLAITMSPGPCAAQTEQRCH